MHLKDYKINDRVRYSAESGTELEKRKILEKSKSERGNGFRDKYLGLIPVGRTRLVGLMV